MSTVLQHAAAPDADFEVLAWRFVQLRAAGYPNAEASQLASSGVDLHFACDLLARGCPFETALRILL